jgi:hypothetical protein
VQNTKTKWICCQLGAREHYAVARALHCYHALELLLTDTWISPGNPLGNLNPNLRARFHPELAAGNVYASNLRSIGFELRAKLAGLRSWSEMTARNEWFQKVAVTRLSRIGSADTSRTLMAYSYAALAILRLARARGWWTVLGQIDPGPPEERIVAGLHEADPIYRGQWERPPPRYWADWREECALADRIVVNSLWSQAALEAEGVPPAKIRVVPCAYHEPKASAVFRRKYPAVFSPVRPLRAIEFTFVGPIQLSIPPDLRQDSKVRWIGSVTREDTARFYQEADVFLFPTFSDGFGLTQLEAQAWKLPIIATKFCGDVVEDGRNGWQLPEVTSGAIAATLRRCLADPAGLQELSANSVHTDQFGLPRVGEQWLHVFE